MDGRSESLELRRAVWGWTAVLAVMAAVVKLQLAHPVDEAVTAWLQTWRAPELDTLVRVVTFFGSSLFFFAVMATMSLGWWRSRQRALVRVLWRAIILGVLVEVVLRLVVGQWRPDTTSLPHATDLMGRFELAGFPSGHAFRSAFLAGWWCDALQRRRRALGIPAAVGLGLVVGLVGLTRIYLHRHWMTDVIGAWVVAAFALAMAQRWRAARTES
ncbi:MAG: phosphatase PAP2 family protein [Candidatus Omnitrophota bacterium]|nr:phosphatase PAP2 family protein [Candidatus Omnitrophota bacterium]